jgi:hypothetical protein
LPDGAGDKPFDLVHEDRFTVGADIEGVVAAGSLTNRASGMPAASSSPASIGITRSSSTCSTSVGTRTDGRGRVRDTLAVPTSRLERGYLIRQRPSESLRQPSGSAHQPSLSSGARDRQALGQTEANRSRVEPRVGLTSVKNAPSKPAANRDLRAMLGSNSPQTSAR